MPLFRKLYIKATRISNTGLAVGTVLFILFSAAVIRALEPETFATYFDGIWWTVVTMATVGYGDFFPVTTAGRMFGIFLMIFGIGLLTVIIGKIVDSFSSIKRKREEGKVDYKEQNHFIIIGWSQKANYAIKDILRREQETEIVLIDQLEKSPILEDRVHYIQGNPAGDTTLLRANVKQAKAVLVFADDAINNTTLADGKTILIAITLERMAPEVPITVEIKNEEHIAEFAFVNKTNFHYVLSDETISKMAVNSVLRSKV